MLLYLLESIGAIRYGEFVLKSGQTSNVFYDIKRALLNPRGNQLIQHELRPHLEGIDAVCGTGLGGALMLSGMYPGIYVREEEHQTGLKRTIEGVWVVGWKVAILEDVITTGGTVERVIPILTEIGLKIEKVICVVNRGGVKTISGIPVISLLEMT